MSDAKSQIPGNIVMKKMVSESPRFDNAGGGFPSAFFVTARSVSCRIMDFSRKEAKRIMTCFRLYRFAFIVTAWNESHESILCLSVFVYRIAQLCLIFQKNDCFDLQ